MSIPSGSLAVGTHILSLDQCKLHGMEVITDGTNAGTVTAYDNPAAASGTIVGKIKAAGASFYGHRNYNPPQGVLCMSGLTVVVEGTGATAEVDYES